MKRLELFIDGACSGNPGEAAIGVVVVEKDKVIKNISQAIGPATNNIAEYTALIYALQEALILRADKVRVNTDSELLYNQIKGSYKVKNTNLKFLCAQIQHLLTGFKAVEFKHVPRQDNRRADMLATKAIKKEQAKMVAPMFTIGEESPSSAG